MILDMIGRPPIICESGRHTRDQVDHTHHLVAKSRCYPGWLLLEAEPKNRGVNLTFVRLGKNQ